MKQQQDKARQILEGDLTRSVELPKALIVSAAGAKGFTTSERVTLNSSAKVDFRSEKRKLSAEQFVEMAYPYQLVALTRRPRSDIGVDILKQLPNLRALALHTTADYWVDGDYLTRRGIKLSTLPGYSTQSVAELAIASAFNFSARLNLRLDRSRDLIDSSVSLRGFQLEGKRLGVIGYGRIGSRVGTMAKALGMQVKFNDPKLVGSSSLSEVLTSSDIVVLAANHERGRQPIIGRRELSIMSARFLINIAVDKLVDHNAIVEAVRARRLEGYSVDEFDEVLKQADLEPGRIVQTMHTGWYTDEALETGRKLWVENIVNMASALAFNDSARTRTARLTNLVAQA